MSVDFPDIIGAVGALIIATAYAALQLGSWHAGTLRYSLANLVGSVMIIASLLSHFNLSAMAIEIFWALVSLGGILRWYLHRGKTDA